MTVDDFSGFYHAVHGYAPFDWQTQLLNRVVTDGWPATISLPTSSGKTSAIDIAIFHLALEAERERPRRQAPLRIFFVIDRRVVVDEAAEHAAKIARCLARKDQDIIREVARRLLSFGGGTPLEVSTMRGGMYRDNSWADAPNQPLVCVSTVDQVGSRLLFRGYQVGDSSRPVHAGLIGTDSLLILDEAHLSRAFRDTVAAVRGQYMKWTECPPAMPLNLVEMSATLTDASTFRLEPESIAKDNLLVARLNASKIAELREPKKKFEDDMISAAKELAAGEGVSVVGVIANTVGSARTIFEDLKDTKGAEAVLLIGRNRPYCAKRLWERYLDRIAAIPDRKIGSRLYVVATQTVEVGANIDFDALVTEAAPLDSLRQRFGRLNRLGKPGVSRAIIVSRPKGDLVYGEATARAWRFLKEREPVDFGVAAMQSMLPGCNLDSLGVNSISPDGPLLFPAHMELWIQTNPTPSPDPEVAPFLHGPQALEAADVQVVWRQDLEDVERENWKEDWAEAVELAPPIVTEALALPIGAVKSWLRQQRSEIADVEGIPVEESAEIKDGKRGKGRPALRWRGPGKSKVVDEREILPGDTIIVPTAYAGADEYGWHPRYREKTLDVGDDANNEQARLGLRRPRLRVALLPVEVRNTLEPLIQRLRGTDDTAPDSSARTEIAAMFPQFLGEFRVDSEGKVITWPVQKTLKPDVNVPSEETDEDDDSSFSGGRRSLANHTQGVVRLARSYAGGCGLAPELADDIALAAEFHDLGKSDERFQSWLYGKPFVAGRDVLLAKSGKDLSRADNLKTRRSAQYPDHARHEAGSVLAASALGAAERAHDVDLVLYLIGVHHGYGRPLFPVWDDPGYRYAVESGSSLAEVSSGGELARFDSGWVGRFWMLNRKYGYWGLAYLESILRRADCMRSRWEGRHEQD